MDPSTSSDGAPPRDLRREYSLALRACNPRQRQWLREVVEQAGQKWTAGKKLGLSKRTVWTWLRLEKIQRALNIQAEMAALDTDLTIERTRREYGRLAFSSFFEFRRDDGMGFKPPNEWTEDMMAAVEQLDFDALGNVVKIKLHRKPSALDAMAKMQNILVDRHEHTGKGGQPLAPPIFQISLDNGAPGSEAEFGIEVSPKMMSRTDDAGSEPPDSNETGEP